MGRSQELSELQVQWYCDRMPQGDRCNKSSRDSRTVETASDGRVPDVPFLFQHDKQGP